MRHAKNGTARIKFYIAVIVIFIIATLVLVFAPIGTDSVAKAAGVNQESTLETYRIKDGDTLWSIAEEHYGSINIPGHIDEIKKLNGIKNENIKAGNYIILYI